MYFKCHTTVPVSARWEFPLPPRMAVSRNIDGIASIERPVITGEDTAWSSRAEPVHADLPILALPTFVGHQTRGSALSAAKRHIDHLLAE